MAWWQPVRLRLKRNEDHLQQTDAAVQLGLKDSGEHRWPGFKSHLSSISAQRFATEASHELENLWCQFWETPGCSHHSQQFNEPCIIKTKRSTFSPCMPCLKWSELRLLGIPDIRVDFLLMGFSIMLSMEFLERSGFSLLGQDQRTP